MKNLLWNSFAVHSEFAATTNVLDSTTRTVRYRMADHAGWITKKNCLNPKSDRRICGRDLGDLEMRWRTEGRKKKCTRLEGTVFLEKRFFGSVVYLGASNKLPTINPDEHCRERSAAGVTLYPVAGLRTIRGSRVPVWPPHRTTTAVFSANSAESTRWSWPNNVGASIAWSTTLTNKNRLSQQNERLRVVKKCMIERIKQL